MKAVKGLLAKGKNKLDELAIKVVHGDSHLLAVAVVMIIVVVIAAIFRTQLTTIFNGVFTQLDTTVDGLF